MEKQKNFVTRFAPSPNGWLHMGHAYSALLAARQAAAHEGVFLLRIEDIDTGRARAHFVDGIYQDLAWLGLTWPEPVLVQSTRFAVYEAALAS
ncbi:MAG TPA: tRNA glutamyl-Q(34) synthetase GluQRS, partial [Rhodobiaceae bacterium]|nr:tRNA glutamyl-Q(34) synthetase GluQRS [Rhodobiaceae bacterium]